MARYQNDVFIRCPLYINIGLKSITCEGITDVCVNKILFNTPQQRDMHCKMFCEKKYENCEIYRMLVKKYEE